MDAHPAPWRWEFRLHEPQFEDSLVDAAGNQLIGPSNDSGIVVVSPDVRSETEAAREMKTLLLAWQAVDEGGLLEPREGATEEETAAWARVSNATRELLKRIDERSKAGG